MTQMMYGAQAFDRAASAIEAAIFREIDNLPPHTVPDSAASGYCATRPKTSVRIREPTILLNITHAQRDRAARRKTPFF
jgi:hypothetical protein